MDKHAPIGFLGGTFDPIHRAHLALATEAKKTLCLSEVFFVPAGRPWQRQGISPFPQRMVMLKEALQGQECLNIDAREGNTNQINYTIDTLQAWRTEQGRLRPIVLIIGADQFFNLPTWHRWKELLDYAHLAVAERTQSPQRPPLLEATWSDELETYLRPRLVAEGKLLSEHPCGNIFCWNAHLPNIAASQIRNAIKLHQSPQASHLPLNLVHSDKNTNPSTIEIEHILTMLPEPVYRYIIQHGLYLNSPPETMGNAVSIQHSIIQ